MTFCPSDGTRLPTAVTDAEAQVAQALARRFRIVGSLGNGGMGTVFLAAQIGVGNRPVALKVLHRKFLDDPDFLVRFQNEAASTGRIHHSNVVTIYESGQGDDGTPYIAMEYLEGQTLRHLLQSRGALPLAECAEILEQAARGLNAAHKRRIIHRDLKPDNIFLTLAEDVREGYARLRQNPERFPYTVKLVDFGIAKLRASTMDTPTGTVLGTPAYMSYEQASGVKSDELDARSDIYSLGVVVYEMLTGRVPFHSDTPQGYVLKHVLEQPPPFRAVKPDLSPMPEVETVVMKALAKDREQRYRSAREFAQEFAQAAAAMDSPAGGVSAMKPERGPSASAPTLSLDAYVLERALTGDLYAVTSVAFSPDGELLGSGGYDNTIKLWDVASWTLRQTLTGHADRVFSIAFSPDGNLLASGSRDKTIKLWDVTSGTVRQTLRGHLHWVLSVAFSPDGKLLASGGSEKAIYLWDVAAGTMRQTLTGHADGVFSVVFSPDGKLLASGSLDKTVKLWDVASGTLTQTLTGHDQLVSSVAFSPNGKLLASGSGDRRIKFWDVPSGTLMQTLEGHPNPVAVVAFSPDGKLLASGSIVVGAVKLWDAASGTLRQALTGHGGSIESIAFSPDGKLLASGSGDKTIKIWRAAH